jgi:hypothetical protein
MESYSFDLSVTPILEPIQLVLSDPSLDNCFSIHLHYNHLTISATPNDPTNLMFNYQTPIYDNFMIPHKILCNYNIHPVVDGYDHITRFLYDTFHLVPNAILNKVLCQMADCARRMVARNTEESGTLEMNVLLRVVTTLEVEEDQFNHYHDSYYHQENVGFSMKSYVNAISSNFKGPCSVCFEEFNNGSHSKLFYAKCAHIFHKNCIARWFYGCIKRSSPYSCPLCRCQIL